MHLILYFAIQHIFMRTAAKLLLLGLTIVFTACQKEVDSVTSNNSSGNGGTSGGTGSTNSTSNIEGDFDFVGMSAHTESAITVSAQGSEVKAVTTSDYITKDNT